VIFQDRRDAGRRLAIELTDGRLSRDAVVLALPRGGVPVGYEVADALGVPLDVFVVRKLGVPGQEELAMGAIASGGVMVLSDDLIQTLGITRQQLDAVARREWRELERRELLFREGRPPLDVKGRTAVLIDDGVATGATMLAAIAALKRLEPRRIVVGVPVAAPRTAELLASKVDELVCVATPEPFYGIGQFYVDFAQISDAEVREFLQLAQERFARPTEQP